jgi:hypothetical protein
MSVSAGALATGRTVALFSVTVISSLRPGLVESGQQPDRATLAGMAAFG